MKSALGCQRGAMCSLRCVLANELYWAVLGRLGDVEFGVR